MTTPRHSLLRRQLKRHHGDAVSDEMCPLLAAVDDAYHQFDLDRQMLERSLELSSAELIMINNEMRLAAEALEHAHGELESRVEERTRQLTAANEALRQAQKMEAIGRLAGGVAHDFNNLLTVIFGQVDVLRDITTDEEARTAVSDIQQAAESAAALTHQLLAFSRRQALTPTNVDVNELVRRTNALLRRLIGEDIELIAELRPGVGSIRADLGQIQQVLLNLGANARDAMPTGGRLTIETSTRVIEPARAIQMDLRPGPYVALTVSDTGTGMDIDVRTRIFEPFFTTKELNRGTGLGLAIVYGIVKQSDGYIGVTSEPNQGTTFHLMFPRIDPVQPVKGAPNPSRPAASGCILVVEDQDAVRRVICGHLTRAGYTVLEAPNGVSALELAQATPHIDLVLTDIVMPQMNGQTLAAKLEQLRPEVKVLYMTGYSDDVEVAREIRERARPLLQKPFATDALLGAVFAILTDPPAATR